MVWVPESPIVTVATRLPSTGYTGGNVPNMSHQLNARSLLAGLIAYWPLNEAGGGNNALDLHTNTLTLTQNSSPGSDTGKVYSAARTFVDAADYFSSTSNSHLQSGGNSITWAAWVYPTAYALYGSWIFSKRNIGDLEYQCFLDASSVTFYIGNTENITNSVQYNNTIPTNAWGLIIGWFDKDNDIIGVQWNNNTPATTPETGTIYSGTAPFAVSTASWDLGGPDTKFTGRIGPIAYWKRALTAAERLLLWNNGAGLQYSSIAGTG